MRRMIPIVLGSISALVLLAGCGIDSGTITSKTYEAPSSYTTQACGSYDSKGQCKFWYPEVNFIPECWDLELENESGDTGSVCVDPYSWGKVQPGEPWPQDLTQS